MRLKTIVILFVVLFVIGTGLITYLWYQARQAGGVDITVNAPQNVEIGVPFVAKVTVNNSGSGVARESTLSLSLPDGIIFMSEPENKRMVTKSLGSLGTGTVTNQEFRLMAVSGENSLLQLSAGFSYVPTDLGSRFEKKASAEITVGESGISLDIEAPQKVFAGEVFEIKVDYENVSDTEFYDLQLRAEYPRGFKFGSSTLPPDEENALWKLGDLRSGSKGSFTIKGSLPGPDGAFYDFAVGVNTSFLGKSYLVNEKTASVSISASPLELSLTVNNEVDYAAEPGETLSYEITYTNNTEVALKDAIIIAKPTGVMLDFASLNPKSGTYRSSDNSILWNASRIPALSLISPGESGSVSFSIKTYKAYEIRRTSDKNFTVKVLAEIESPTVPSGVASSRTTGSATIESKVGGGLVVTNMGSYKNSVGITNSGPIPMKVGQPTTFTIHWTVRNGITDMQSLLMKTFLGPNVRYTGTYKASNNVAPTYNERTQEFAWSAGDVPATTGYATDPIELVFQVEVLPSSDQINQAPTLLGETTITANDAFVAAPFFDKHIPFTTLFIKESPFTVGDMRVTP